MLNAYTSELLPTDLRGDGFAWSNNLLGRVGYVLSPLAVGQAALHVGWGPAVASTAVFPLVALGLILWWLPETRGRELEEPAPCRSLELFDRESQPLESFHLTAVQRRPMPDGLRPLAAPVPVLVVAGPGSAEVDADLGAVLVISVCLDVVGVEGAAPALAPSPDSAYLMNSSVRSAQHRPLQTFFTCSMSAAECSGDNESQKPELHPVPARPRAHANRVSSTIRALFDATASLLAVDQWYCILALQGSDKMKQLRYTRPGGRHWSWSWS